MGVWQWTLFCVSIMLGIQIILNLRISKEITKSFAWFVTLLMAVLIVINQPPFFSYWVIAAIIGKTLGDGFYGSAHLLYGVPGVKENSVYDTVLKHTIIATFFFNLIALFVYIF